MKRFFAFVLILGALLLGGCAPLKQEAIRTLRSVAPVLPEAPKYTEGPKLYV